MFARVTRWRVVFRRMMLRRMRFRRSMLSCAIDCALRTLNAWPIILPFLLLARKVCLDTLGNVTQLFLVRHCAAAAHFTRERAFRLRGPVAADPVTALVCQKVVETLEKFGVFRRAMRTVVLKEEGDANRVHVQFLMITRVVRAITILVGVAEADDEQYEKQHLVVPPSLGAQRRSPREQIDLAEYFIAAHCAGRVACDASGAARRAQSPPPGRAA